MKPNTYRCWTCVVAFCAALALPTVAYGMDLTPYKPQWTIGQTWRVESDTWGIRMQEPSKGGLRRVKKVLVYGFKVEALTEVEDEPCCQIRFELIRWDGKEFSATNFFRAFIRVSDSSLKKLQECSCRRENVRNSWTFSEGPVEATLLASTLPLAFPVFSEEANKYAPPDPNRPGSDAFRKNLTSPVLRKKADKHTSTDPNGPDRNIVGKRMIAAAAWQKHEFSGNRYVINGEEMSVMKTSLSKLIGGKDDVSKQVWAKGLPWYLQAEHESAYCPHTVAKLTHVNGVPVVVEQKKETKDN